MPPLTRRPPSPAAPAAGHKAPPLRPRRAPLRDRSPPPSKAPPGSRLPRALLLGLPRPAKAAPGRRAKSSSSPASGRARRHQEDRTDARPKPGPERRKPASRRRENRQRSPPPIATLIATPEPPRAWESSHARGSPEYSAASSRSSQGFSGPGAAGLLSAIARAILSSSCPSCGPGIAAAGAAGKARGEATREEAGSAAARSAASPAGSTSTAGFRPATFSDRERKRPSEMWRSIVLIEQRRRAAAAALVSQACGSRGSKAGSFDITTITTGSRRNCQHGAAPQRTGRPERFARAGRAAADTKLTTVPLSGPPHVTLPTTTPSAS